MIYVCLLSGDKKTCVYRFLDRLDYCLNSSNKTAPVVSITGALMEESEFSTPTLRVHFFSASALFLVVLDLGHP